MLERLQVKNFKLLRDVDLALLREAPTVLIGTNSSGKTTVLEVLDFLARCATDGLNAALVAHGGLSAVRTIGVAAPVEIRSTWNFTTTNVATRIKKRWTLTWTLAFTATVGGGVRIVSESLTDDERALVSTNQKGQRVVFSETEPTATPTMVDSPSVLAFEALVDIRRYEGLGRLRTIISQIRVLCSVAAAPAWGRAAPDRVSARDSMIISTQNFVGREGIGLATAMYNLQTDHSDAWSRLDRAFRAEYPFVRRIVFPADPGGSRISFAIEDERFPGRRVYASEMSDGMIAFLCLLSLILHPQQKAVLALDEPDVHLHPSAVRRLLSLMSGGPTHRRLILVTHSNAVLDELADPASMIRIVEATSEGARIRSLEPEALAAWRTEYSLSDLRKTGLLDPSNTSYSPSSPGGEVG